jgi:hypothetical protein
MRQPSLQELEKSLHIDEDDLECDCRHQPVLYYEVSKQLATLISQRDEAKQNLAEVEAEQDTLARTKLSTREGRVMEGEIKAMVKASKVVVAATQLLLRLNTAVGLATALKDAYSQRSYALAHLVDLHIHSMYGEAPTNRTATNIRDAKANHARVQLKKQRQELTK